MCDAEAQSGFCRDDGRLGALKRSGLRGARVFDLPPGPFRTELFVAPTGAVIQAVFKEAAVAFE